MRIKPTATVAALAAAAAALAACGSQTKTVSVAGSPPATAASTQTTGTGTTAKTPATTTTPASTQSSTTRTATEPAFVPSGENGSAAASAAAAAVRSRGYTPNNTSEYHDNQTLRVLTATRTGSGDGYDQRAFFFIDGRYIGTDTSAASASVKVVAQSDTSVTLAYPVYRHGDPLCCPGGGQATVRFELNNGKLAPAGPIPPASSRGG